jgi:carboxymethylenebutenolidase
MMSAPSRPLSLSRPAWYGGPRSLLALAALLLGTAAAGAQESVRTREGQFISGGVTIRVEHFEPATEGKYPAVVLLYGCDGMEKSAFFYRAGARRLAGDGYVVLLVRYLDRTGVKELEPRAGAVTKDFPLWLETARDGVTYARRLPNVVRERVGLIGISLGAFLAVTLASEDERVAAVVDACGGLHRDRFATLRKMPPTLILHGDTDTVVPVEEARKLERLLKDKGQPCEIKVYPGQGHDFDAATTRDAGQRTKEFLDRRLKGNTVP